MEKEFFYFTPKHLWREMQIEPVNNYDACKLLVETDPIVSDSRYIVKKGSKHYDIIPYLDWMQFLISEKFKNILERENFNGYKCFAADIEGVSDTYFGWLNICEVGPIIKNDWDKEITWFDLKTWHGFDIFHLKDTKMNVCTKEVRDVIERENITNIKFESCIGVEV
jgi:hypothetical protein